MNHNLNSFLIKWQPAIVRIWLELLVNRAITVVPKAFLLIGILVITSSCYEDNRARIRSNPPIFFFRSNVTVEVIPPDAKLKSGLVVHLYDSVSDFERKKPSSSLATDSMGRVRFENIRMGEWFVDCTIPGNPPYYGDTLAEAFGDTNAITFLLLEPVNR